MALAPIVGTIGDETLVIGESSASPVMFGLPTRNYTVDHTNMITAHLLLVVTRTTVNHAHYRLTVVDLPESSAALRVTMARGFGHALAAHPEAFTGLPLQVEGTVESANASSGVANVNIRAIAFRR